MTLEKNIENIEKYEDLVNSFVTGTFNKAQILKSLNNRSKFTKSMPLNNISFGVKDIINVDGYQTRCGSKLPSKLFNGKQSSVVTNLLNAGARFIAKTVTAEFAISDPGKTRNPRNLKHTPGGSSSGSGASVAAGFCDIAIGTQTCGSIIIPAGYCGVIGYKPSFGRINRDGVLLFSRSMDHVGIISKNLNLLDLVLPVIVNGWKFNEGQMNNKTVLGLPGGSYLNLANPNILKQFLDVCNKLENQFEIKKTQLVKNISKHNDDLDRITFSELYSIHSKWFEEYKMLYKPISKETIELGKNISNEEFISLLKRAQKAQIYVQSLMLEKGIDAWIAPVAPDFAPEGIKTTGDYRMNSIWSYTGLPVITIPTGSNEKNLPYSIQIIGKFGEDEKLLRISHMIEAALKIKPLKNEWELI